MEQTQPAKRPFGVTANGVIALLGSLLTLGMCALMVLSLTVAISRAAMPAEGRVGLVIIAGVFGALAGLGIATAIGLFRLRNWARISTVVFGVLLGFVGLLAAPMMLLIPAPSNAPASFDAIRMVIAVFYGALGLLGVFWVYYFSRRATRDVFGVVSMVQSGGRPLSISIIGWWFLIAGIISVMLSPLRMPTTLFVWLVIGWGAAAWYVVGGSMYALCGYGLLKLRPAARQGAIALVCLGLVNGAIVFGAPGSSARMAALMSHYRFGTQPPPVPYFTQLVLIPTTLTLLVPLWFLIARKRAFYPSDSSS